MLTKLITVIIHQLFSLPITITILTLTILSLIYLLNPHYARLDSHSIINLGRSSSSPTGSSSSPTNLRPILKIHPTLPQSSIPSSCLEPWISRAIPCTSSSSSSAINRPFPIDLIWTWVNQSTNPSPIPQRDPSSSRSTRIQDYEGDDDDPGPSYLYREHDELRFSLRSTLESLPSSFINSRQIISADAPHLDWFSRPDWLSSSPSSSQPQVLLQHHSQIFRFLNPLQQVSANRWLRFHVPSHNSLAIESQFGHLSGIKNNFLYLNDDCFFINKFTEGDFSTELFGPVFRIQFDLEVSDDLIDRSGTSDAQGEWPSLGYSNYLLSQRFGSRPRRYLSHLPKVSNIQIMMEVSEIWKEEIFVAASSRFRGQKREINMMFLTTWYHIEKHREAMLHSFIMLKSDVDQDGILSDQDWNQMMQDMGVLIDEQDYDDEEEIIIPVYQPFRPVRDPIEEILGEFSPIQTEYSWSSQDGYPLVNSSQSSIPNYRQAETGSRTVMCQLNVTTCFPRFQRAEQLMHWITVDRPKCGDCLIGLLIGKERNGIEAFLPRPSARTTLSKWFDLDSGISSAFSSSHKDSNDLRFFSNPESEQPTTLAPRRFLRADPRLWAIRNIQRYQYVLGETRSDFQSLTTVGLSRMILNSLSTKFVDNSSSSARVGSVNESSQEAASNSLEETDRDRRQIREGHRHQGLLVTINDRILPAHISQVHQLFKAWLRKSWPRRAPWELEEFSI